MYQGRLKSAIRDQISQSTSQQVGDRRPARSGRKASHHDHVIAKKPGEQRYFDDYKQVKKSRPPRDDGALIVDERDKPHSEECVEAAVSTSSSARNLKERATSDPVRPIANFKITITSVVLDGLFNKENPQTRYSEPSKFVSPDPKSLRLPDL